MRDTVAEPTLFEPARGGAWDALTVMWLDVFSKWLQGMVARKDASELLEKRTVTVAAS